MSKEIKHGQKITINNKLKRVSRFKKLGNSPYKKEFKVWEEQLIKEKEVIFLGYRTLSNGRNDYYSEYGNLYTPEEYFQAALISENSTLNPYYTKL
jgi:hypothetical protein